MCTSSAPPPPGAAPPTGTAGRDDTPEPDATAEGSDEGTFLGIEGSGASDAAAAAEMASVAGADGAGVEVAEGTPATSSSTIAGSSSSPSGRKTNGERGGVSIQKVRTEAARCRMDARPGAKRADGEGQLTEVGVVGTVQVNVVCNRAKGDQSEARITSRSH